MAIVDDSVSRREREGNKMEGGWEVRLIGAVRNRRQKVWSPPIRLTVSWWPGNPWRLVCALCQHFYSSTTIICMIPWWNVCTLDLEVRLVMARRGNVSRMEWLKEMCLERGSAWGGIPREEGDRVEGERGG